MTEAISKLVVVTSVLLLLGGILWPPAAETFFRIMIVVLALSLVGIRLRGAGLPSAVVRDRYSPFDSTPPKRERPGEPATVRDLARVMVSVDDREAASRAEIPLSVQRTLVAETRLRLHERHGLRADDPLHHDSIRRLVSAPTAELVLGEGPPDVPVGMVPRILDDLENL